MVIVRRMSQLVGTTVKSARWVFDCNAWFPTESDLLRVASGIQLDEKIRVGKFVYRRDAKYSMVGRLLIRKYVVDSTGLDWDVVCIKRDSNNKPVLTGCDVAVQFNVSHQGNYAVLAGEISTKSIGVDVMRIEYSGGKSVSEFFRIMSRQFSDDEWSTIKGQTSEWNQLSYFYRFWCLKESYVKGTGTGVTVNLKDISFKLNSPLNVESGKFIDDTELFLGGVKQTDWIFQELMIDKEHCCAVALNVSRDDYVKMPDKPDKFQPLSFDVLVEKMRPVIPMDVAYCREFLEKEDAPC